MNKIIVTGFLGKDSELKFVGDGKPVLNFSIAVNDGYGDKKQTFWWRCNLWGSRAEKLAEMLLAKTKVLVEGKPQLREYEKDGVKKISPEIFVGEIEILRFADKSEPDSPDSSGSDDQVPF